MDQLAGRRLVVNIPGGPCAQGRPRVRMAGPRPIVYDPPASRSWKGAARVAMQAACREPFTPFPDGPVSVVIRAFHACPRTDWRKREPTPRCWRSKRPDAENVAKAVLDAATSVLWSDDAQVARLVVELIERPVVTLAHDEDGDPVLRYGGEAFALWSHTGILVERVTTVLRALGVAVRDLGVAVRE